MDKEFNSYMAYLVYKSLVKFAVEKMAKEMAKEMPKTADSILDFMHYKVHKKEIINHEICQYFHVSESK